MKKLLPLFVISCLSVNAFAQVTIMNVDLDNGKAIDISQLASIIKSSSFVVANDTGPAHMSAHLNVKGLCLFGSHTSAFLQSVERENFKPIQVSDLNNLSSEKVFEKIIKILNNDV